MRQDMTYVYTVYQEGSFSKAAEKLFLTQPALSISIQKIEQSIGMPLFDRSRRPLQLTEAGEIYIDTIKKTLLLEKEQQQRLNDIRDLATGTVQLGGSHYLNAYILPDILTGFSRKYPGIRLEIIESGSSALAEMLADNKLDLTFSCHPQMIREFDRFEMFEDHILLAVPDAHPINSGLEEYALTSFDVLNGRHTSPNCPAIELNAFSDLEFILLRKGNNLYDRAQNMFRAAGFEPKIKLSISQLVTAFHLAAANMGATFVSDRLVKSAEVPLKYYKLLSSFTNRMFYMLLPRREYTSFAVRALIQYIQENL